MNYPQDAIKDRFEHDPDFCYDCSLPKDECVCEPEIETSNLLTEHDPHHENKTFTPSELLSRIKSQAGFEDKPKSHNATCEAGVKYPSIEAQEEYWKQRDAELDRIESCSQWFEELERKHPFQ